MECTQRLECTQDLYETRSEKICPEQIGILGICGVKHPVKKGPNKIGRDPQTCSIVLNLNSISRQHAVINVLNQKEFMLMDLDSANKTKLMDKTLPAYIPHPLKNGDMVQFGDIFGVFRLLEEETELPMTQAIDLPETPVANRNISRINNVPVTTIPESPDISDREESFIAPSQPKGEKCFKNSSNHFIKPSAKVISIQPVGSNKIDNVYWNSSKKSVSLNSLNDSSLNSSTLSNKTSDRESNDASIFEMETQPPTTDANDSVDSIYNANTQVPNDPPSIHTEDTQIPTPSPSIHNANTQIPIASSSHTADTQIPTASSIHTADTQNQPASPPIHSLNTQLPLSSMIALPEVCKIDNQQEMQFDLYATNKQNDSIFEADTQPIVLPKSNNVECNKNLEKIPTQNKLSTQSTKSLNVSDEVILFDELDCQQFEDDFASQPLLPPGPSLDNDDDIKPKQSKKDEAKPTQMKKIVRKDVIIHSDSSTDCEDIDMLPTQKILSNKANDDEDLTDCEDLFGDDLNKNDKPINAKAKNHNFEDMSTQVIPHDVPNKSVKNMDFEDMPTQVIENENNDKSAKNIDLVDMPTQIIVADDDVIIAEKQSVQKDTSFEDMPTQVINDVSLDKPVQNEVIQDFVSPFKIPLMSPIKLKRKDIKVTPKSKLAHNVASPISVPDDDDNYYAATQDILDDLCTQPSLPSPSNTTKEAKHRKTPQEKVQSNNPDEEFLPSSVEDYETGDRFPHLENLSPRKNPIILNKSFESSDGEEKVNNFVSKLSNSQIRDMVGVESHVASLKRSTSDPSDIELTPKKVRPAFMDIDLPSSQEIKTSVSVYHKSVVTESSSESEVENDSEECTPILFHKKKKPKIDAKIDLTKVFETEALPTRVITRVRKPTSKIQNSDDAIKLTRNILKPKYLTEQEDDIDKEIITENITRLKNKSEKSKNKDSKRENKKNVKVKSEKENAKTFEKVDEKTNSDTKDNNNKPLSNDEIKNVSRTDKSKDKLKNSTKKQESNAKNSEKVIPECETKSVSNQKDGMDKDNTNTTIEITLKNTRSTRNRRKPLPTNELPNSIIEKDDSQNENPVRSSRRQNNKNPVQIDLTEEIPVVRRSGRKPREKNTKSTKETERISDSAEKSSDQIDRSSEKIVKSAELTIRSSEKATKSSEKPTKSSERIEKPSAVTKKPAPRRGRPPKHEQSTVYSLSSDSSADSPRNSKRSATEDLGPPSPKRTRSAATTNSLNTSLRATPARLNKTHHVLFTAFPSEEVKAKLEKLGAVVVSDVSACTVVLTMQVKRTFKLLCAVGLGRPIVGPSWVQACADTNMIVDPWLYILKDEAAEKRFQFNLERTLTGKRNFLKGYNVSSTPSVMPSAPEMKLIVESSGGTWKESGPAWACVSCSADRALWPALRRRGAVVVSTEFILGGVLRQRADLTPNKLQ